MLTYLKSRGCKIGGVTMGAKGMIWYDETRTERFMPSLSVPDDRVIDTNGAGDIFHGAYVYSYLRDPDSPWERHFKFARAASAHAIQHLGNEASLPTLAQTNEAQARFAEWGSARTSRISASPRCARSACPRAMSAAIC
jgi:sugar/nucleoside kinase (ribokinase family)